MGKGKRSFFASLFGFNQQSAGGRQPPEEEAVQRPLPPPQRYYQGTRVRLRDDEDDCYGRYGYGDRDIDKKATEFIQRVHRGMLASDQDG